MNIGIDIGGSHIAAGLVKEDKIIDKIEISITEEDKNNIKLFLELSIVKMINKLLKQNYFFIGDIDTIGIAVPGTVIDGKKIGNIVNLGIKEFDLYSVIKKYYKNSNIKIKNDAKCAAIAEKLYGNMKNYSDALFICLGTGVGGALYIDNKLIEPKKYSGLEIGHMSIEKNGEKCNCGKYGCFDVYGSMKNFKKKLTSEIGLNENAISFEILPVVLENNNENAKKIIDNYITDLSIGISNLINIFEPEIIVIGGSFAYYESILLEPLKQKIVNGELLLNKRDSIKIVPSKFLNDSGIIGAGNI